MEYKDIVTAPEAVKGFYPTPFNLATKLLRDIKWGEIECVLEPSAGKGDLIEHMARIARSSVRAGRPSISVDAVEIDPALQTATLAAFGEVRRQKLNDSIAVYEDIRRTHYHWESASPAWVAREFPDGEPPALTDTQKESLLRLEATRNAMETVEVRLIHDDFLTLQTMKRYDLIMMNPPFANGDEHLEKAIAMQERYGGEIRCILNAETLRNPYTVRRKMLVEKLANLGADIQYVDNAFANAERSAKVDVAIVRVTIPAPELKSDIFERLTKAEAESPIHVDACTDITMNDLFGRMVAQYNVEVKAGIELIRTYHAMVPYIMENMAKESSYDKPIIELKVWGKDSDDPVNRYVRAVRNKYWTGLFHNPEFTSHLTNDLQNEWRNKVSELDDYDFTVFNIRKIAIEMNGQLQKGVEEAIEAMFHKLTDEHAWYADAKTIHYYTGWKTNQAHMVGMKAILPAHGAYAHDDIWKKDKFDYWDAANALRDLEKVLDFFDGEGVYASVDMSTTLATFQKTFERTQQPPKNIALKHFSVSFFKKGTVHIKFHDQKLIDRFNIYCARQANELPPDYGKKAYGDLTHEEKVVVDSFNGDGTDGSGEKSYTAVFENQGLYLSAPTERRDMMALPTNEN